MSDNPLDAVAILVDELNVLRAQVKRQNAHLRAFVAYFEQDKLITPAMIAAAKAEYAAEDTEAGNVSR
jgi:hypothetical protein